MTLQRLRSGNIRIPEGNALTRHGLIATSAGAVRIVNNAVGSTYTLKSWRTNRLLLHFSVRNQIEFPADCCQVHGRKFGRTEFRTYPAVAEFYGREQKSNVMLAMYKLSCEFPGCNGNAFHSPGLPILKGVHQWPHPFRRAGDNCGLLTRLFYSFDMSLVEASVAIKRFRESFPKIANTLDNFRRAYAVGIDRAFGPDRSITTVWPPEYKIQGSRSGRIRG